MSIFYDNYKQYGMTEDECLEMAYFSNMDQEEERVYGSEYLHKILQETLDAHLELVDSTPKMVNGLLV